MLIVLADYRGEVACSPSELVENKVESGVMRLTTIVGQHRCAVW